jgi:hypothetical protein
VPNAHSPADDIFFDLVAIQYHALKGVQVYDRYLSDAQEHDDVRAFIAQVKEEDSRRAEQAHRLLGELTREHHGAMR